jgi:hypothetical protein
VDVPLSTSTTVATRDELFSATEQLALAGFLAGYRGLSRDAYTLDLRQYVAWCTEHRVAVFGAHRADIECFARHLESLGRARPRSRDGCAPCPASTATPNRRASSPPRRRHSCGDRAWTANPTPPAWTASRWAPCSWRRGWPAPGITR